jgi:hypothetical protein
MDPITLRLSERILDILIGGISIYLGYRLFFRISAKTDSNGKIILPGNVSIYLTRVGPGVFFALFGAMVVGESLHNSIRYTEGTTSAPERTSRAENIAAPRSFGGVATTAAPPERAPNEVSRGLLRADIAVLNALPTDLKPSLPTERRVQIEQAIPRIKLALMGGVWASDWGDRSEFEKWVQEGSVMPPPAGLETSAKYYTYAGGK